MLAFGFLAAPGGRTELSHGLKRRVQKWFRLPEPRPPQECSRCGRRPDVGQLKVETIFLSRKLGK
jgi:hypothetical protein